MKAKDYAYAAPRLKAIRTRGITVDQLRELLTASPKDIRKLLSELPYTKGIEELGDPRIIDLSLRRVFMGISAFIRKIVPEDAAKIIDSIVSRYIGSDVAYILVSTLRKTRIDSSRIPSIIYEPELGRFMEKALEEQSYEAIVKELGFLDKYMNKQRPLSLYESIKEAWSISWGFHFESTISLLDSLSTCDTYSKPYVEYILCPKIDYELLSTLLQLSLEEHMYSRKLVEAIRRVYPRLRGCKVGSNTVSSILEQIGTPQAVLTIIQRAPVIGELFQGREALDALINADTMYRRLMRKRVGYIYATIPFHAGLALAALQMVELDLSDVRMVSIGILTGVNREMIRGRLSITV